MQTLRASWKGHLKLSQVVCAVALYPASSSTERISLNLMNVATGHRLKQDMVDEETGETVAAADRVRGYEQEDGAYLQVTDDEVDALGAEADRSLSIDCFVPIDDVDELYRGRSYYVAADGAGAAETFAIVREAMRRRKVAAIGHIVIQRREHMLLLEPSEQGLLATILRGEYEIRDTDEVFEEIKPIPISDEMIDLARHIVDTKSADFDPDGFDDRYQEALLDLIKAKRGGKAPRQATGDRPSNVIDLMDALRKSADRKAPASSRTSTHPGKPRGGKVH